MFFYKSATNGTFTSKGTVVTGECGWFQSLSPTTACGFGILSKAAYLPQLNVSWKTLLTSKADDAHKNIQYSHMTNYTRIVWITTEWSTCNKWLRVCNVFVVVLCSGYGVWWDYTFRLAIYLLLIAVWIIYFSWVKAIQRHVHRDMYVCSPNSISTCTYNSKSKNNN